LPGEERHLLREDPTYAAYAGWMAEHGAITKWFVKAARLGRASAGGAVVAPAE